MYNKCFPFHFISHTIYLKAGTPQGSPLSPLIYLIYVNDFPEAMNDFCSTSQFADDTALFSAAYTKSFAMNKIQKSVDMLEGWCRRWRVKLNASKSNLVFFSRLPDSDTENHKIALFNDTISPIKSARFLGVEFDEKLNFNRHFTDLHTRAVKRLSVLRAVVRAGVDKNVAMRLYKTYILPIMEYGSISFIAAPKLNLDKLQKVQNEAIRVCLKLPSYIRIDLLHESAGLEPIATRLKKHNLHLLSRMLNQNEHVRDLCSTQPDLSHLCPKSPLDTLLQ